MAKNKQWKSWDNVIKIWIDVVLGDRPSNHFFDKLSKCDLLLSNSTAHSPWAQRQKTISFVDVNNIV